MKTLLHALILLCVATPFAFADLIIRGSDTLGAKMVPQLAEAYRKLHPTASFQIAAEGSNSCFKNLLASSCDIGMASRPVKEEELKQFKIAGLVLKGHVVAHDMIAVIVNAQSPVKNLTLKEVEQIFTGSVRSWDHFGGSGRIKVFTRNTSSGTYKVFQKLAMNWRDYGVHNFKITGGMQIRQEVSQNPKTIGYCGLAYTGKKGVRAVKINGVEPTAKQVHDYPLSRDLFFYTVGDMTPEIEQFIEWVKGSKEARTVIEQIGFIPLQPQKPLAEQGGADQPATAPESKPEGSEKPRPEAEGRSR